VRIALTVILLALAAAPAAAQQNKAAVPPTYPVGSTLLTLRIPGPPDPADLGVAIIACRVTDERRLAACQLKSENPKGFGARALKRAESAPPLPNRGPPDAPVESPITIRVLGSGGAPPQ